MKRKFSQAVLLILLVISFFVQSCRYDEGPAISFYSAGFRLEGQYHVKKIIVDDVDCTEDYTNACHCDFLFDFDGEKNGDVCLLHCKSLSSRQYFWGTYQFEDHARIIAISFNSGGFMADSISGYGPFAFEKYSIWEIKKLQDAEMILESTFQNRFYRVEFEEFEY